MSKENAEARRLAKRAAKRAALEADRAERARDAENLSLTASTMAKIRDARCPGVSQDALSATALDLTPDFYPQTKKAPTQPKPYLGSVQQLATPRNMFAGCNVSPLPSLP